MNNTIPTSPSTSYTVLTQNPVHEVKNMSWKVENALMTIDSTYKAKLPLPTSCPVKINVLVKFRRLTTDCSEVSVGLQRMDKKRNISIQMTYDLNLANLDKDVYAKKKAVIQLDCSNLTPYFVLSAKFTNSAMGGSNNNDPDCIRLDTTILQALATKNLFVLNENQEIFFLLPGNVLFVVGDFFVIGCCTMTRSLSDSTDEEIVFLKESKKGQELLIQDFKAALDEGVQSDIQIKVEEDENNAHIYNLHKFVLAARSPYFRRLLEEHKKETQVYTVSGAKVSVFDVLVKYLYSGDLDPLDDIWSLLELYSMVLKFEMESLRSECIRDIQKLMKEDEVWDVLDVAVQNEDQVLKDLTLDFIAANQDVVESEKFNLFVETQKDLAAEILKSIITKRKRKE